jgi:hopanoid biosynthesis associated radical SAM protein HpnH
LPVPISQMWTVASYVLKQKLAGRKRYPLVLMLEPLFRCNLACAGCGKIQYPAHILKKELSPEECFKAVEECGAPMVSIPGGEPLMHSQIAEIVKGLVARRKYIYLCTNALLLKEKLDLFTPSKYLTFSVHVDGEREHHDFSVCREGDRGLAHLPAKLRVERGGGRFLEHLLVPPLHRALALAEGDHVAVRVAEQLDLHVTRALDVALAEDALVAERGLGLPPRCSQ